MTFQHLHVMAGLVPAIHAVIRRNDASLRNASTDVARSDRVDARDKRGHDGPGGAEPYDRPRSDGAPEPLGVTPDASGANVAVFSAHAEAIELCLFDDADEEIARIKLPARSGDVFHGYVEGLTEGQRYGFRAYGPDAPDAGHRFNPAKLLVDPYALALDRAFTLHPSIFAYGDDGARSTAPRFCRKRLSRSRPCGVARGRSIPGAIRSSMNFTSRASPRPILTFRNICAGPSPVSRMRRRSRI